MYIKYIYIIKNTINHIFLSIYHLWNLLNASKEKTFENYLDFFPIFRKLLPTFFFSFLNMWYCFRTSLFLIANLYSGDVKNSLSCFIFLEGQRLIIWILGPSEIKENSVWSMSTKSTDSLRNKR